jgi:DNA-binding FadR family transcriptional regulator
MAGATISAGQRKNLVSDTADRLRDMVFAAEAESLIGSLQDLAKALGVGIVTLQQAARVLEHEGLLEARRGPGGGYYGKRPDAAALERSFAAYMRANPASFAEALDLTSLLFNELVAAAAGHCDRDASTELRALAARIEGCDEEPERGAFEADFQDLLFRMVDWPLFELLTQVTLRFAHTQSEPLLLPDAETVEAWKAGRHRIIDAILQQDRELARFEADRSNRRVVLERLHARQVTLP